MMDQLPSQWLARPKNNGILKFENFQKFLFVFTIKGEIFKNFVSFLSKPLRRAHQKK
jgi:hypothetical protein